MVDRLDESIRAESATSATTRQFVDDAAHELRTPITAVAAYAELLTGGHVRNPDDTARINQGIVIETDRLRRLIEELLYLARIDEHRDDDSFEKFDVVPIALQAADTSMLVGPSWPIDLDTPDQAWCVGSAGEIRRVFDNLLSNIRTHTPAGTDGRISIETVNNEVRIRVEDSGPGISADDANRLFDRFWRGDESRARATGGTGLGLSIVQAVVDHHRGTVRVERRENTGMAVTITFRSDVPLALDS